MNKLVRDKIPDLIQAKGEPVPHTEILHNDAEFLNYLKAKLVEESQEVMESATPEAFLEEMADVFEVITALLELQHLTIEKVINKQKEKREAKGAFQKRLAFIEKT